MKCEVCASHGKKVRSFDVVKLLTFLFITQFHISKVQTKSHRIIWAQSIFNGGIKIESLFFAVVSYHKIGYLFEKREMP